MSASPLQPTSIAAALVSQYDFRSLRRLWTACLFSPFGYLLLGDWLHGTILPSFMVTAAPSTELLRNLLAASLLGSVVALAALGATAWRYHAHTRTAISHGAALFAAFRRRTITMLLLSEMVVLQGLLLYLVNGNLTLLFGFALVTLCGYGLSYPGTRLVK